MAALRLSTGSTATEDIFAGRRQDEKPRTGARRHLPRSALSRTGVLPPAAAPG